MPEITSDKENLIPDSLAPLKLPDDRELVMRVMPMPADVNANGDVFGGWIMAQVDVAGGVLPARIAKGRIATVAVNQFVFKQPVSIGDLLSFYAKVERIGRTSVTGHVEVDAPRALLSGRKIGLPWQPELAYAAGVDGNPPEVVINDEVASIEPMSETALARYTAAEVAEIQRRRKAYLGDRVPLDVTGRE